MIKHVFFKHQSRNGHTLTASLRKLVGLTSIFLLTFAGGCLLTHDPEVISDEEAASRRTATLVASVTLDGTIETMVGRHGYIYTGADDLYREISSVDFRLGAYNDMEPSQETIIDTYSRFVAMKMVNGFLAVQTPSSDLGLILYNPAAIADNDETVVLGFGTSSVCKMAVRDNVVFLPVSGGILPVVVPDSLAYDYPAYEPLVDLNDETLIHLSVMGDYLVAAHLLNADSGDEQGLVQVFDASDIGSIRLVDEYFLNGELTAAESNDFGIYVATSAYSVENNERRGTHWIQTLTLNDDELEILGASDPIQFPGAVQEMMVDKSMNSIYVGYSADEEYSDRLQLWVLKTADARADILQTLKIEIPTSFQVMTLASNNDADYFVLGTEDFYESELKFFTRF